MEESSHFQGWVFLFAGLVFPAAIHFGGPWLKTHAPDLLDLAIFGLLAGHFAYGILVVWHSKSWREDAAFWMAMQIGFSGFLVLGYVLFRGGPW